MEVIEGSESTVDPRINDDLVRVSSTLDAGFCQRVRGILNGSVWFYVINTFLLADAEYMEEDRPCDEDDTLIRLVVSTLDELNAYLVESEV